MRRVLLLAVWPIGAGCLLAVERPERPACDVPDVDMDKDEDGDGHFLSDGDCDDKNALVFPDASEICDGADNDCDCKVDELPVAGQGQRYFQDTDGDGHGVPDGAGTASEGTWFCGAPANGWATTSDDCDDQNTEIHPGATELCDPSGVDEDCDGLLDDQEEGVGELWYPDEDGDGYGTPDNSNLPALQRCTAPPAELGYVYADRDGDGDVGDDEDCNDSDYDVNPNARELCGDDADQNCDGRLCTFHDGSLLVVADARWTPVTWYSGWGQAIAVGDLDGDLTPELLVGANALVDGGGIQVFSSIFLDSTSVDIDSLEQTVSWSTGESGGTCMILWTGSHTVAVGAPFLDATGVADRGAVYIFEGMPHNDFVDSTMIWGGDAGGRFGAAGAVSGEDGAGLWLSQPGGEGTILRYDQGTSQARHWLSGDQPNSGFGESLAVGDFNGDGVEDLAVGAPGLGEVSVYSGPISQYAEPDQALTGGGGDDFGRALVAGEFLENGYTDLVVGAPLATAEGQDQAGKVYIYYANVGGLNEDDPSIFSGEEKEEHAGMALAAGQLDAYRGEDFVVLAPGGAGGYGRVYVVLSTAVGLHSLSERVMITGTSVGHLDRASLLVADLPETAGGVGDGLPELLVGTPAGNRGLGEIYVLRGIK